MDVAIRDAAVLIPRQALGDDLSADQLFAWTSTAAALDAFDAVLDETAMLPGRRQTDFGGGILEARRERAGAEGIARARSPARRGPRDGCVRGSPVGTAGGVRVRPGGAAFSAISSRRSVAGRCGAAARGLETSADLQREERFLFELATTRATEDTILSYPRFDERARRRCRRFFWGLVPQSCETRAPASTLARSSACTRGACRFDDQDLLERLAGAQRILAPTSIESFLQCPFQFFASKNAAPAAASAGAAGSAGCAAAGQHSASRAWRSWTRAPLLGAGDLDASFRGRVRQRLRVPEGYRTEAVRLELLRNFAAFWTTSSRARAGPRAWKRSSASR